MRRKDREITDVNKIREILDQANICRLGFYDGKEVYIVPLVYGYQYDGENLSFYFHSAQTGRKIDLINSHPRVGFEIDGNYELIGGELACDYTNNYHSIIGNGVASLISDKDDKISALNILMNHVATESDWTYSDKMVEHVAVIKVTVEKFSVKEKL